MQNISTFISEEKIQKRVRELSENLSLKFKDKTPVFICILNGAAIFYSDLIRNLKIDIFCDFISLSSYGSSSKSSGEVKILSDVSQSLNGKDVVLVEDIVDSGLTMSTLQSFIKTKKPKSITTVTLLLKPKVFIEKCPLDHVGFEIPNDFVVGYGMDYQGYYRGLPYIGQLSNLN